ncbi:MAG: hypothetical protein K8S24_12130 [Candidatus Aegiribacteria sp.]|nr:hypothetical protein [Candidatus Aegiribacteria sp.]
MRAVYISLLMLTLTALALEDTGNPMWVNACEVVTNEAEAEALLDELAACGFGYTGYLWIPDSNSLSGFEGWLVYNGPFDSAEDASISACYLYGSILTSIQYWFLTILYA